MSEPAVDAAKAAFSGIEAVPQKPEPEAHEVVEFPTGRTIRPSRVAYEIAADDLGLTGRARQQFVAQCEIRDANIAECKAQGLDLERDWTLQQQPVVDMDDDHIEQTVKADGRGHEAMFSSAFAHIPVDSPFLPK